MLRTRLCDILGIAVPIILPPTGGSAKSAEYAAAVANLGGLGVTERLDSAPETGLNRARFVAGSSARAKAQRLAISDERRSEMRPQSTSARHVRQRLQKPRLSIYRLTGTA